MLKVNYPFLERVLQKLGDAKGESVQRLVSGGTVDDRIWPTPAMRNSATQEDQAI